MKKLTDSEFSVLSHLSKKDITLTLTQTHYFSIIIYMKETAKILMSRDGLTQAEAVKRVVNFFNEMKADWETGGDISEWEHIFMTEFGLEPDYFEDFIFRLC